MIFEKITDLEGERNVVFACFWPSELSLGVCKSYMGAKMAIFEYRSVFPKCLS